MDVLLFVNSRCNTRCKHCYLSYTGERDPKDALKMTKRLQGGGHEVQIAGSETLLNPDYLKTYKQTGQGYLLTNGMILDQDKSLYDSLEKHGIEELVFSLHFDIQKDLKSVPEDLVARVIKEAKIRGFRIGVYTVITSANYGSLASMCERSVRLGIDELLLLRFVSAGRGSALKRMALTPEEVAAFFKNLVKTRKKYPKSVLEIRAEGNFGPRPGSKGEKLAKENKYCPAGIDFVAIDPRNNVYGCSFLMQPENKIGICRDGEIIIEKDLLGGRRDTCIAHLIT